MTDVRSGHRRRGLLVVAALLAALEVVGSVLASAVVARASLAERTGELAARQPDAAVLPLALTWQPARPASPWARLAAELPVPPEPGARTQSWRLADEVLDPRSVPAAQPGAPTPMPAKAGDTTTAAPGGLAGASRTAVAVAPRLRIPDLGINRTIRQYPCDRAEPPANYVYRWGCAGSNNLYLLGHADSVFKALHDAYASGRLRVGMTAQYTDAKGRTTTFRVTTWRVVLPTEVSWAIASQPVPSMTLQTCFGANSEYRLLVRLVAA